MEKKIFSYFVISLLMFSLLVSFASAVTGTCKGFFGYNYCGQKSKRGDCYCDAGCGQRSDCCSDFETVCQQIAPRCGNNFKEGKENCDGTDFGSRSKDCTSYGYIGGTLICSTSCNDDFSGCISPPPPTSVCGNAILEDGEYCDRNADGSPIIDPNRYCTDFPEFSGGTLGCTSDCKLDTSNCVRKDNECKDSDSGRNYETYGTIKGYIHGVEYGKSDYCTGSPFNDYHILTEFYCDGNSPMQETFTCPYTCSNGRCVPPLTKEKVISWINSNTIVLPGSLYSKERVVDWLSSNCKNPTPPATVGQAFMKTAVAIS